MGNAISEYYIIKNDEKYRFGDMHERIPDAVADPHEGFDYERKPRVQIATFQEMEAAKLPMNHRDYCAHLLLAFEGCRKQNFPCGWRCHHEKHALDSCRFDDYVIRMKEYERGRRLEERKAKLGVSGEPRLFPSPTLAQRIDSQEGPKYR